MRDVKNEVPIQSSTDSNALLNSVTSSNKEAQGDSEEEDDSDWETVEDSEEDLETRKIKAIYHKMNTANKQNTAER